MYSVSVIVAAWNAAKTITTCVESIVNQSGVVVEVIIVNDCSTDNTDEVLQELKAKYNNLVVINNATNRGPSFSRNQGLSAATFDWVAIVDADDAVESTRFFKMIDYAVNEKSDLCFDNLERILSSDSKSIGNLISVDQAKLFQGEWSVSLYADYNKPYESPILIGFLKPVIKRSFLNDTGLKYNEQVSNSEDYLFVLEAIILGCKISYLDQALYRYYIYPASLSGKFNFLAHKRLIEEEILLLSKYKGRLSTEESLSIKKHIQSLKRAANTNLIFLAIRQKNAKQAFQVLKDNPQEFFIHLSRIANSIRSRLLGSERRGH